MPFVGKTMGGAVLERVTVVVEPAPRGRFIEGVGRAFEGVLRFSGSADSSIVFPLKLKNTI